MYFMMLNLIRFYYKDTPTFEMLHKKKHSIKIERFI
ncbi:hypothetical protein T190820D02B_60224 [Tenacibaculum sp. 190524A05c]